MMGHWKLLIRYDSTQLMFRVVPFWFSWYSGRRTSWTTWWVTMSDKGKGFLNWCFRERWRQSQLARVGLDLLRSIWSAADSLMNVTVTVNRMSRYMYWRHHLSTDWRWRNQQW